jgi:lysophospholipase L1-like esterase
MATTRKVSEATRNGQAMARRVLRLRGRQLIRRTATVQVAMAARPTVVGRGGARAEAFRPVDRVVQKVRSKLGPPASGGLIVAEGDSWFDYPLWDILQGLEDDLGFEVESVAHKGDRIEEMAYSDGQLSDFVRLLDKLLRRGDVPRAILLSGGGNDIAGESFEMLLNHVSAPTSGINVKVMEGVIDIRLREAFERIVAAITEVCRQRLGNPLPIVVHGYDYPVPDGRGFLGGWWLLPGPWLEPGFRQKGYQVMTRRKEEIGKLMDHFNEMLKDLASRPEHAHLRYVDLRGTLSSGADYRNDWGNELHPTEAGFAAITARIAAALS